MKIGKHFILMLVFPMNRIVFMPQKKTIVWALSFFFTEFEVEIVRWLDCFLQGRTWNRSLSMRGSNIDAIPIACVRARVLRRMFKKIKWFCV